MQVLKPTRFEVAGVDAKPVTHVEWLVNGVAATNIAEKPSKTSVDLIFETPGTYTLEALIPGDET